MHKLIINGEIGGEGFEFIQNILDGLECHGWLKRALKDCLARDPGEAHNETLLLFQAMQMRVGEIWYSISAPFPSSQRTTKHWPTPSKAYL